MSHAIYTLEIDAERYPDFNQALGEAVLELTGRLTDEYHFLNGQNKAAIDALHPCENHKEIFDTYDDAWHFLHGADYRNRAYACRYRAIENYTCTKQENNLIERFKRLQKEKEEYAKTHAIRNYKKTLKKHCTGCTADIPVRFFRSDDRCPLCGKSLRSESVTKALASYDARMSAIEKQMDEIKKKRSQKMKRHLYWMFIADVYIG